MAAIHKCNGKTQALVNGVCPACGTVCKEHTVAEINAQKAAYEARGGVWGLAPKEPVV